jgi:hypothetical protein
MKTTSAAYDEALALARANGDPARISNALYNLSFLPVWADVDSVSERAARAEAEIGEALALARQVGERGAIARCLWAKASELAYLRNDLAGSLAPLAEAVPMFRAVGDHFGLAWALHSVGLASVKTGDLPAARAAFDEELTLLHEAKDPSGLAIALADQAQLASAEGERLRAVRLRAASAALEQLTGAELVSKVDSVEGRVIETTPEEQGAWKEGLAMTVDQAVAFALRKPSP